MYRDQNFSHTKLRQLWIQHARDEKWIDPTGPTGEKLDNRILELFGSPPYRFLKIGDPVPLYLVTRKRRTILDPEYKYQFPTPNYSALPKRAQFVEIKTETEWWRASGEIVDSLRESGQVRKSKPILIQPGVLSGTQVFFVRLPISSKRSGRTFPTPGTLIKLLHVDSKERYMCRGKLREMNAVKNRSTGWAIVDNFICLVEE